MRGEKGVKACDSRKASTPVRRNHQRRVPM
eukprot:COSAG05_NODE_7541_length_799_cov_0.564286_1_plen_29_part_10